MAAMVVRGDDTRFLLPNDIIIEILSWLPAKSLLHKFRWTCKYWFNLITRDTSFIKMHVLHHSTAHNHIFSMTSLSVLSVGCKRNEPTKIFQFYLNYNNTTGVGDVSSHASIAFPFDYFPRCSLDIISSCNGLILLYECTCDDLCIWNPFTEEYRFLPRPLEIEEGVPHSRRYKWYKWGHSFGFGYDHTNDDYKVIRNKYYDNEHSYSDVQVYTLGTNSWRRIIPNPYRFPTYQLRQAVFLNGALYWIDISVKMIMSFDFGTEKIQPVSKLPNFSDDGYVKIQEFEGSLCMILTIIDQQEDYGEEIWVMKDYAVNNNNESLWTKLSTIPNLNYVKPLRCTKNGEILMVINGRDLVLYDGENNNTKTLVKVPKFVQTVYAESLVSLKSGTYKLQGSRTTTTTMIRGRRYDEGVEETIFP